ncbi:hypothetical protein C8J57DRAFT_1612585 [Mycena rebaudengoi]|nr:hypothetical protein C8J57DRAFT_1612585 [Mycena rebaudengoi]
MPTAVNFRNLIECAILAPLYDHIVPEVHHVPTQLGNLIQYTTVTASTIEGIARAFQIPFLSSAAALTLSILKCVEAVRSNRNEWMIMVEQIHEILCIIITLCSTSEIKGVLPTALLYDIAKFTETLQKIFTLLTARQKMGKIKQLFKQPDHAGKLETCKQELNKAIGIFRVRAGGSTLSQIENVKKDAKQQHDELMALLNAHPDLSSSDHSSVIGTLSSSGNSLLPASPKIFHGRESDLKDVVNVLLQNSAHIVILGAGGMGKTSLAIAALHDPQVEAKYSHRYFVPCHSSPTCTELAATIADHIGLEKGSNMAKKIAHHFAHAPPSLLVLDNLETPWETLPSRPEVEEFLSLVTDVPHLGLMITLRGAERPSKVKWSRPFLAPLEPISNVAAWQTFIEVAGEGHDDASIKELLELTGNLPLAVSLIASVAASEGCVQALSRWKLESTRMLSDGYDQRSSLDISIMLSYTSSRMTPGAQELLSILSLLPDGLADADLVQAKLPISAILACKATLIQTALAFVGQDQHLKVLVPIREHILNIHPPANALKLKLREHFHQILDLWNQFKDLNVADIVPQISRNLGNFHTVFHDGLELGGADMIPNIRSILFLNRFYQRAQNTYSPLLLQLSGQLLHLKDHPIFGEYLVELLEGSYSLPYLDFNSNITLGTQYFKSKGPLEQARWYCALAMYSRRKSDLAGALKYYQTAYSLAESIGHPNRVGIHALNSICNILNTTGKPLNALTYAQELHRYAEHMGNIYGQACSLAWQGQCHTLLGNYRHAQCLLQKSRHILATLGPQQSYIELNILNWRAEIHLLKTEYLQSRSLQVAITSSCQPTSYDAILANLNIALIDIATGADSKIIRQNLDIVQSHLKALYGYGGRQISVYFDYVAAELCLRDGALGTVNALFEKCFALSLDINTELALTCLERLGDLSTGMSDILTTLRWTGIFLGLALKCNNKLQTMQAFHCLGQIFSVQGDNETALSLFNVALDGFTFMDVHRWRADCMVRIGDILNNQGEVMKAVELWNAARPLFERSSQMKDIAQIDAKLAEVDSAVLAEYEEQLQQLSELHWLCEVDLVTATNSIGKTLLKIVAGELQLFTYSGKNAPYSVPRQSENGNGDKGNYALKQSSTAYVRDAYGSREGRTQSRAQFTYPNPPRAVHPRAARHAPPHGTFMPKLTAYIHAAPMPPLLPRAPHKGGQIMAAPPTSIFANGKPKNQNDREEIM